MTVFHHRKIIPNKGNCPDRSIWRMHLRLPWNSGGKWPLNPEVTVGRQHCKFVPCLSLVSIVSECPPPHYSMDHTT